MTHRIPLLVAMSLSACRPEMQTRGPAEAPDASATSARIAASEVAPGEVLLYLPEGDPRGLLGREVTRNAEGQIQIATERRPGCIATVSTVDNAFARTYESELRNVAGFDADVRRIAQLQGRFERELALRLAVDNEHVLRGDLEGNCGATVITEVKVGRGSREVVVARRSGGSVAVDLGAVGHGAAGGERVAAERETLSWDTPQAWGVRLSDGDVGRADLEIEMPERLVAEQRIQPRVIVNAELWLVVMYRDASGHHGVLLPRAGNQGVHAARQDVSLPPMVPSNLPGHDEDRETLLVFGFRELEDFKRFRPPAGAIDTAQADAYAKDLRERLDRGDIPRSRWSSAEFTYVIHAAEQGD